MTSTILTDDWLMAHLPCAVVAWNAAMAMALSYAAMA